MLAEGRFDMIGKHGKKVNDFPLMFSPFPKTRVNQVLPSLLLSLLACSDQPDGIRKRGSVINFPILYV
jgi:hypothetical protein